MEWLCMAIYLFIPEVHQAKLSTNCSQNRCGENLHLMCHKWSQYHVEARVTSWWSMSHETNQNQEVWSEVISGMEIKFEIKF